MTTTGTTTTTSRPTTPRRTAVRVLVVDAEPSVAARLSRAVRPEGWRLRGAADAAGAVRAAREFRPDVVVLDMQLPDLDGLSLFGRLRRELPGVPVLFLTGGRSARPAGDRVAGLTAGGDACVGKPFRTAEVVGRLNGLVSGAGAVTGRRPRALLTVGDLTLDEDSREVARGGVGIRLTSTEFELLRFLMRNPRRVLSKAQILDRVWSHGCGGRPENVVELYVSYLRKKIDAGRAPMIHTRRGAGYLIRPS
ncbi:response regulator transcription factor [Streptomyces sp. NPDC003717]|uniref:response regulator transcription factor n=1 Tax=Streptomyces sp. NPDC003717 TaxID=3154276 RepID=UPI0033A5D01A